MEDLIARMQDEKNGIPIRTVKSFLSKIPSVFSGKALDSSCETQPTRLIFYKHKTRQVESKLASSRSGTKDQGPVSP